MDDNKIQKLLETRNELRGNCSGVYFLFDGNEIVYIGKSWNCFLRIAEQTRTDKIFTSWNYIHIENETECNALKIELISKYSPKYNRNNRG